MTRSTIAAMHAIIQSIRWVPAPSGWDRPSICRLQLRSKRAVLLDILYLLLCFRLVSQLLSLGFWLRESAPSLLTRLDGLSLGLFSGVDSWLEGALFSKPFIGLSDELNRFLSRWLTLLFANVTGNGWFQELSVIAYSCRRFSGLRWLILWRNWRFIWLIFSSVISLVLVIWDGFVVDERWIGEVFHELLFGRRLL